MMPSTQPNAHVTTRAPALDRRAVQTLAHHGLWALFCNLIQKLFAEYKREKIFVSCLCMQFLISDRHTISSNLAESGTFLTDRILNSYPVRPVFEQDAFQHKRDVMRLSGVSTRNSGGGGFMEACHV